MDASWRKELSSVDKEARDTAADIASDTMFVKGSRSSADKLVKADAAIAIDVKHGKQFFLTLRIVSEAKRCRQSIVDHTTGHVCPTFTKPIVTASIIIIVDSFEFKRAHSNIRSTHTV